MMKSEKGFAPFDLSKTRKFDRKKDQESLRQSFYKLAAQYFEVSLNQNRYKAETLALWECKINCVFS